jgi:hypothetical protein
VGRGVEDAFALKGAELAGVVVDEEVGAEDALVAAEDDVCGVDEGEVALEPVELGGEGGGDLHGGGGDEDLILRLEALDDAGGVGHDVEDGEEVFGVEVACERVVVLGGDALPEVMAVEVSFGEGGAEGLVVAEEMLGDGVGHHLIHVDANSLFHSGPLLVRWFDFMPRGLVGC